MKAVACRRLRGLHPLDYQMAARNVLQGGTRRKETSQGISPSAKSIARDLHDRAMRISGETDERGAPAKAFVADNPDFDGFALPRDYYEGNEAAVREVYEFEFVSGLVQTGVAWEVFETEQRTHGLKFTIWKAQKNAITDGTTLEVRAFASQQRSWLRICSERGRTERLLVVHRSKMHIKHQRGYLPQHLDKVLRGRMPRLLLQLFCKVLRARTVWLVHIRGSMLPLDD